MEDLNEQIKIVKSTLEKHKGLAHVLTPIPRSIDLGDLSIPPYTRVAVRTVWISAKKDDGETYTMPASPANFILSKIGLQKLGAAAGIRWSQAETFVNDTEAYVAAATITGTIVDLDGTERSTPGRSSLDLRDNSPQTKKITPAQLGIKRSSILSLVETGAKNKVRRELLGVQGSYTAKELEKPFIIFTLVPDKEQVLTDFPVLRKALALQQIGISAELFQAATRPEAKELVEAQIVPPKALLPANIPEEQKSVVVQASVEEILKDQKPAETPTQPDPTKQEHAMTPKLSQVIDLYAAKGLRRGASKPVLSNLTDAQLDAIIESLAKLPDKKTGV
jgi:hypothetical protein